MCALLFPGVLYCIARFLFAHQVRDWYDNQCQIVSAEHADLVKRFPDVWAKMTTGDGPDLTMPMLGDRVAMHVCSLPAGLFKQNT